MIKERKKPHQLTAPSQGFGNGKNDDEDDDDDDGAPDSSGRGKRKRTSAAAKRMPKSKPTKPETNKTEKGADNKDKPPDNQGKQDKRTDNIFNNAQKVLQSLAEVTVDAIWRSLIRSHELDRRLSKAAGSQSELQKLQGSKSDTKVKSRASKLEDEISQAVTTTTALKEFCRILRLNDQIELGREISKGASLFEQLKVCASRLLAEPSAVQDMIHAVAKKLIDAPQMIQMCQFLSVFTRCPFSKKSGDVIL